MSFVKHPRCPFCHEEVLASDPKRACEGCMAWHHRDCWGEGGDRCAACGVASTAPLPTPGSDLSGHLGPTAGPVSPLVRPACCRDRPCARHAVLSSLLLALDAAALRKIAHRVDLELVADCPASVAREVLRAVDVELADAARGPSREELGAACERLGLGADGTKRDLVERVLARSMLVRTVYALPLTALRRLAKELGLELADPRWIEGVQRELLRGPGLDFATALAGLGQDDLTLLCGRFGVSPAGTPKQLERRLRDSATVP